MNVSYSTEKPNRVEIRFLIGGTRRILLHDNIRQEEIQPDIESDSTETMWACDESEFVTSDHKYTKEYVEENFDEVWVLSESKSTPLEERIRELEHVVSDLSELSISLMNERSK